MAVTKEIVLEVGLKDSTAQGTESAKKRLRDLQRALVDLAVAGQENSEEFRKLEAEAGELSDTIGDVSQRVKNLGSDTKNIEAFTQAVQGVAAGFQIAQGAAALFGEENEDIQKAMLQVNATMAIANGIQQVTVLLQKESAISMTANRIATALYDKTLKGTIVSLRLFRTALISTGIGAAIVGVGLLVENWEKLTKSVKDFLGIETKDLKAVSELAQRQVELAEARGESEAKVQNLLMAAYDARIAAAEKEEERAQLIHEKEVARLTYRTKLRTDAVAKQKENTEKLKELDKDALKTSEELHLSKITNESERERELLTQKLDALKLEEEEERKAIIKQFTNEEQREYALLKLKEKYIDLNILLSEESAKKIAEIERKNAEERKQFEQAVADFKKQVVLDSLQSVQNILQSFGKESKGLAIAALALEKGLAVANVIVNLQKEMAANAVIAAANPANAVTGGAAGVAQLKAYNTLSKIRAGLRIAAITAAGIQAGKAITSGGDGGSVPAGAAGGGASGAAAAPPPIFANPNVTDLSGFGQGQGQGSSPMRAYVVERDITQSTRRVRRLEEFATLGA
jgi:hypothetical protein